MRTFKFLIVGAFVLTVSSVQAQRDMILTQAGEQVRCRIIDETPVRFVFAYLKNGKPYRSEIFKTLVTSFKFNYYDADLPNADKLPEAMYRATGTSDSESPRALSSENNSSKKVKKKRRSKKSVVPEGEKADGAAGINDPAVKNEGDGSLRVGADEAIKSNDTKVTSQDTTPRNSQSERLVDEPVKPVAPATRKVVGGNDKTTANSTRKTSRKNSQNNANQKITDGEVPNRSTNLSNKKAEETTEARNINNSVAGANSPVDISETELPNITINQKNKFRIGIKGGIGNRLDNNLQTTSSFDLYQEQLLRGFTLGADVAYFPNDVFGFGVVFTDFRSRNSDNEISYRNEFTGAEQIGSISNNRSVKFVGPALFFRKKLDYKTYVVLGLSPGYNSYTDNGSYENVDYTFKGGGFGVASTLGIDFLLGNDIIGRDIILSFEAGYNYGRINSLDYGDARGLVDLPTAIDLSRLDFTVGLRFIRFPKYFRLTSY